MKAMDTDLLVPEWLEPRQRIFQRHQQKVAIRLEEEFWKQLDDCAGEAKIKLSDLVFDLLERTGDSSNRAALLRVFCVRWLRQRLTQARRAASTPELPRMLSACPTPCVIMTTQRAIVAYNAAFSRTIIKSLADDDGSTKSSVPLTFRLEVPLETIRGDLESGNAHYKDTKASFIRESKVVNVGARFCLMADESGSASLLLCFVTK